MDIDRDRMAKERHRQYRSSVLKFFRRRRNQPSNSSSSIRLADAQNRNRDSIISQTKIPNKRSKS